MLDNSTHVSILLKCIIAVLIMIAVNDWGFSVKAKTPFLNNNNRGGRMNKSVVFDSTLLTSCKQTAYTWENAFGDLMSELCIENVKVLEAMFHNHDFNVKRGKELDKLIEDYLRFARSSCSSKEFRYSYEKFFSRIIYDEKNFSIFRRTGTTILANVSELDNSRIKLLGKRLRCSNVILTNVIGSGILDHRLYDEVGHSCILFSNNERSVTVSSGLGWESYYVDGFISDFVLRKVSGYKAV